MAVRPQTINERPRGQLRVCRCWWEKRFNSMYLKTLDFSEAIASDHESRLYETGAVMRYGAPRTRRGRCRGSCGGNSTQLCSRYDLPALLEGNGMYVVDTGM